MKNPGLRFAQTPALMKEPRCGESYSHDPIANTRKFFAPIIAAGLDSTVWSGASDGWDDNLRASGDFSGDGDPVDVWIWGGVGGGAAARAAGSGQHRGAAGGAGFGDRGGDHRGAGLAKD